MSRPELGPIARHYPDPAKIHAFADALAAYEEALARLESWGIRISPSSRLRVYATWLRRLTEDPSNHGSRRDLEGFAFCLREINEVTEIVQSFGSPPSPEAVRKLGWLHKGSVHPDEGSDSRPRDFQYELALFALLQQRSVGARLGEPDLTIEVGGLMLPVEAKRPRGRSSVAEALEQGIAQAGEGGIAALSLDLVIRPRDAFGFASDPRDAARVMDHVFLDYVRETLNPERDSAFRRAAVSGFAAGLLVTFRMPMLVENEHGMMFGDEARYLLFGLPGRQRYEAALKVLGEKVSSYPEGIP